MSEPDDSEPTVRTLTGEEAQAALQQALRSVADAFDMDGRSGLFGTLQALGRLNDPDVQERLRDAAAHIRELQARGAVQGQAITIDLRGTEQGQALRGLVERFGGAGLASLPGVIVRDEEGDLVEPSGTQAYEHDLASPVPPEAAASHPPHVDERAITRAEERVVAAQPSLVEDAGGGLFGWLGRLFGGPR